MKKNIPGFKLSALLLLFVLSSCRTPPPGGIVTPNPTEISMVETAQVLLRQTEQIGGISPTVIPPRALTPTPQVSYSGTSLMVQEDQTTEFIDYKAGIKLTLPAGWLAVRINEDEYYKAFATNVVLDDSDIYKRLNQIQTYDVNFFRLDVIDIRPGHVVRGMISDISVIFQENDYRTLEEWAKAEKQQISPYSGYKFLSSKYQETTDGTRVLVIEESWDHPGGTLYNRCVFLSLPTGTLVLDLQTNIEFKDTVLPDFEQVVNSLALLETQ